MLARFLSLVVAIATAVEPMIASDCSCSGFGEEGSTCAATPARKSCCCGESCRGCCRRIAATTDAQSNQAAPRKACCAAHRQPNRQSHANKITIGANPCNCRTVSPTIGVLTTVETPKSQRLQSNSFDALPFIASQQEQAHPLLLVAGRAFDDGSTGRSRIILLRRLRI